MSKKLIILLLITAIILTLGCTGTDQPSTATATPVPTAGTGDITTGAVTPSPANATTPENESTPEMDLPLPPDLSDLQI